MGNQCVKKYDDTTVIKKNTTDGYKLYFMNNEIGFGGESIIKTGIDQYNKKIIIKVKKKKKYDNINKI